MIKAVDYAEQDDRILTQIFIFNLISVNMYIRISTADVRYRHQMRPIITACLYRKQYQQLP